MWLAWIKGVVGLWIVVAPFTTNGGDSIKIENICIGVILFAAGWYTPKGMGWQRWMTMIIGGWIFIKSIIPCLLIGIGYL